MKVKLISSKVKSLGIVEGKEYEVLAMMKSASGGFWVEIKDDLELISLVKVGGTDYFGVWEVVA